MADTILTLTEIEDLFYDLTVSLIGGTPDVRHSWPTQGAPAFGVSDNVTFLKVYDVPGVLTVERDEKYSQVGSPSTPNMATRYTRNLMVNWIFYGAQSWNNAISVRNKIFYQEHHDTLARKNIYMVPDFEPPKRMPELWQGLWYERADLTIKFNEAIVVNETVPYLESAEIIVVDHSGVRADIVVEE